MFSDTYKMKLIDNVLYEVYGKVNDTRISSSRRSNDGAKLTYAIIFDSL